MSKTKELTELVVDEVSLVDAGANPDAHVLVYKAADMATCPVCKSKVHMGAETCAKCGYAMKKKAAEPRGDDMTEADKAKLEADVKAAEELATEEQTKRVAAEKRVKELEAEIEKRRTPEEIEKAAMAAIPESFRKRLESAEAEIKKAADEKATIVHVEKARALKHLPVKAEEFGLVLKAAAASMTAEQAAELDRVLKAADEAMRPLFTEIGKSGAPANGDAVAQFIAKVDEAKAKGEKDPMAKAASENPALYNAYRNSVAVRA